MAEMTLPKRDRESISSSIKIKDITELMFGSVLEINPDKKLAVDYGRKRVHIYLRSHSSSSICLLILQLLADHHTLQANVLIVEKKAVLFMEKAFVIHSGCLFKV